jgi:hypothetical protein
MDNIGRREKEEGIFLTKMDRKRKRENCERGKKRNRKKEKGGETR